MALWQCGERGGRGGCCRSWPLLPDVPLCVWTSHNALHTKTTCIAEQPVLVWDRHSATPQPHITSGGTVGDAGIVTDWLFQ